MEKRLINLTVLLENYIWPIFVAGFLEFFCKIMGIKVRFNSVRHSYATLQIFKEM